MHVAESESVSANRREYSRVDSYIPLEYRLVPESECQSVKSRITGEVMVARFDLIPSLENHPNRGPLTLLNKKLDTIIQNVALQCEGFHSLAFKFVSLGGSGIKFSSPRSYALGDILEFKMILAPNLHATIYVYGEVVRVGKQTNGFFINVRFTEISDAIREVIVHFVFEMERELLRKKRGDE